MARSYPIYGEYPVTHNYVDYKVTIHYQGAIVSRELADGVNIFWSFNDRYEPIFRCRREIKDGKLVEGSGLRVASSDWHGAVEVLSKLALEKDWLLEKQRPMTVADYLEKFPVTGRER